MKALLVYDLNDPGITRACIATLNAATAQPCPHGCTWQCSRVHERYAFVTQSRGAAVLLGNAVPDPTPVPDPNLAPQT
jgi:hypothetical protein